MGKNVFASILDRILDDEALRKRAINADDAEFAALLAENGAENVSAEVQAEFRSLIKEYVNNDGELSEAALNLIAGGGAQCMQGMQGKLVLQ